VSATRLNEGNLQLETLSKLVEHDEGPRASTVEILGGLRTVFQADGSVTAATEVMGIGPKEAIPQCLKQAGIKQSDLDWIELNEAFAAQALAVVRELDLDMEKVNPWGGAIALGHPLGATGAIRTATIMNGLKQASGRYGMVTMCIGTGMGFAMIVENLQ